MYEFTTVGFSGYSVVLYINYHFVEYQTAHDYGESRAVIMISG